MAYLSVRKEQQVGLAPALRSWLVSLAGGVALGLAMLILLVASRVDVNALGLSKGTSDVLLADLCEDGDHEAYFLFLEQLDWVSKETVDTMVRKP